MKRAIFLFLLATACCGQCGGNANQDGLLCDRPFQVGPDYTSGECYPGELCLPSNVAPCMGDDCCHSFCAFSGCGSNNPCLTLDPANFPLDGGPAGCGCDDAGPCACAGDAGPCLRASCLQVCSNLNLVASPNF